MEQFFLSIENFFKGMKSILKRFSIFSILEKILYVLQSKALKIEHFII